MINLKIPWQPLRSYLELAQSNKETCNLREKGIRLREVPRLLQDDSVYNYISANSCRVKVEENGFSNQWVSLICTLRREYAGS